jgi:hypothetical protein
MTSTDPRALEAAEKYRDSISGTWVKQHSKLALYESFIAGIAWRDAAGPPESPAPPASPPPEGEDDLPEKLYLVVHRINNGKRTFTKTTVFDFDYDPPDTQRIVYVRESLLAEAKQQGRAEQINRDFDAMIDFLKKHGGQSYVSSFEEIRRRVIIQFSPTPIKEK